MSEENTMEITAEILPNGLGGWYIEAVNTENGMKVSCQNFREYSMFMQDANAENPEKEFKVTWLPSEKATKEQIEEVRQEMLELEKFYE